MVASIEEKRAQDYEETALRSRIPALAAVLALVSVTGCAAIRQTKVMRVERTLAASGFQIKLAKTPEQLQQVEKLPQRKLVRVPFENDVRYLYADGEFCDCIYAGTESAFGRYRIAAAEQIEQEELASSMVLSPPEESSAIQANESLASQMILDPSVATIDWDSWGPWGPWY